jgi:hypothetical protein
MNDRPAHPAALPGDAAIESREAFHQALLDGLHAAAEAGCPELWFCDTDFSAWPLGRPVVVEALTRWVGSRRRLRLLAADYSAFAQGVPRWHAWRRRWAHVVHCHAVQDELAAQVPTLLLAAPRLALRLHDRTRYRGRVLHDINEMAACREQIDALMQRAEEALPVTTLGL